MPSEKFPTPEEDQRAIEHLIDSTGRPSSTYMTTPFEGPPKYKKPIQPDEQEPIIIHASKGSISLLIVEILQTKYPTLGISLGHVSRIGRSFFLKMKDGDNTLLYKLFQNAGVRTLEMHDPEISRDLGIELEKEFKDGDESNGFTPGLTDRIYLRYLRNKLKILKSKKDMTEGRIEFNECQEEINEYLRRGIAPITDKEIRQIIESTLERIFGKPK